MERITEALRRAKQQGDLLSIGAERRFAARTLPAENPDDAVIDSSDAQTSGEVLPRSTLHENRIISAFDPCPFTESFKILSTQVSRRMREHGWSTLAVTSPCAGEGKTMVSINLAMSLAMDFHRTALLVDGDLRQPAVRTCLGLEGGPGLSDYFIANTPVEKLLVRPTTKGFVVLPGGSPVMNSPEILGSPRMAALVRELKHRYPTRIVVFDLPPLLTTADALAFAPHVDAALLVVEEGKTRREDIGRSAELLGSTNLIGIVLNKSREEIPAYGRPPPRRNFFSMRGGA